MTSLVPVKSSASPGARRKGTSAPCARATSAISPSSVLTMRNEAALSCPIERMGNQRLASEVTVFLRGIRFEPPRAGIMATASGAARRLQYCSTRRPVQQDGRWQAISLRAAGHTGGALSCPQAARISSHASGEPVRSTRRAEYLESGNPQLRAVVAGAGPGVKGNEIYLAGFL